MRIHGLNKTTLLDYPGKLASTIFLGTCNFRCPFCHNKNLVCSPGNEPVIPEDEIFAYLKKRSGMLEGVCVTGGEPTLSSELPSFIAKIKELGYKVKLDTNGYRPDMIRELVEKNLLDYIAMDIKSDKEGYSRASGLPTLNPHVIESSVDFIMSSGIDYEFRTTLVREMHGTSQIKNIGQWLAGCKAYYLQPYRDSENIVCPGFSAHPRKDLEQFLGILSETISHVKIRGID